MNQDIFWGLIAETKARASGNFQRHAKLLQNELVKLPSEEILSFYEIFREYFDRAYRWDLWAAAYIIGGGCSDDSFMDFRSWLISMGKDVYEQTLMDVDTLAQIKFGSGGEEDAFFEEFHYCSMWAYEKKNGAFPQLKIKSPTKPAGEDWEEEDLERLCPKLWAKYGEIPFVPEEKFSLTLTLRIRIFLKWLKKRLGF